MDDDCDSSTDESNGSCASGKVCFRAACRAAPASYCTQEQHEGHLYAFCSSGLISWDSADAVCLNWGGTQVVLNSASELSYVRGKVGGALTWIGYSDKTQEGTWVWEAPGPYITQWCSGEPNDATNEDCAQLNWHSDGCWNDCECWLKTSDCTAVYCVCEMS